MLTVVDYGELWRVVVGCGAWRDVGGRGVWGLGFGLFVSVQYFIHMSMPYSSCRISAIVHSSGVRKEVEWTEWVLAVSTDDI